MRSKVIRAAILVVAALALTAGGASMAEQCLKPVDGPMRAS